MSWAILLGALLLLGLTAAAINKFSKGSDQIVDAGTDCSSCDGNNQKCEQECMMEASLKDIEYFEDEELDAYIGRPSEEYSDEEAEEFREVMMTMRPEEVASWNRSLILRGIHIPNQIRDELLILLEDNKGS